MSYRPWLLESGGKSLEALVGAYQIRTGDFSSTSELIQAAETLFEIQLVGSSVSECVRKIKAISKSQRSRRGNKNRKLVTSSGPARSYSKSEKTKNAMPQSQSRRQNYVRPLTPKDVQELGVWLKSLKKRHKAASDKGFPWARCYAAEIRMIENGLRTGRM